MKEIIFDEAQHIYTLVGDECGFDRELISVTTVLAKHGLAPDYTGARADVMRIKSEKGRVVHAELENFIKTGDFGFTREVAEFAEFMKNEQLTDLKSEQVVFNDIIAGTFDISGKLSNGKIFLGDFKTTAQLNKESVRWQLSIYNKLNAEKADILYLFHFDADGFLTVYELEPVADTEIETLFEAERNNEIYKSKTMELSATVEKKLKAFSQQMLEFQKTKAEYEKAEAEVKEYFAKNMEAENIKALEFCDLRIVYIEPVQSTSIDTTRLKKEKPEIAQEYEKTTTRKGYVKITQKTGE